MRLTVHVTGAKKTKREKNTKDGVKTYDYVPSTLSFENVQEDDLAGILKGIQDDGLGKPFKHYFSNDRAVGRATLKSKA